MQKDDDSAAPANPGRMVAGYGYFGLGGTMAEYLERELAWRRETGQDRPIPPKLTKQAIRNAASTSTDYPWLRADWVEPKVEPLRLRNRR